jgi:tetratricopeptide (TPR) repeat protein
MNRFLVLCALLVLANLSFGQHKSTITDGYKEMLTYPYSDPNPNPLLSRSSFKIYPYHSFDGFSSVPRLQKWKIVTLENDYIRVFIFPELGGKVWGAIDKSTGKEFIYSNDVVKFRNIAMRGPWTSGGIEFNLGLIGHTPATAGPVDYVTRENADGSVSCIVGNMDLPSRTQWRVEIRLPKDKAYFETIPLWYNPTPISQSYYCFMTGAAVVTDDLEFFYPGNQALEHSGEVKSWPEQDGHIKSMYANNAYNSHTSVHVVGEYNDFMGGYYHKSNFGFGHWALYNDMPGRKLWLWALSREGEIWKDLLTDKHGQYMEFQAGRTFNQYAQSDFRSPIKEMGFNPGVTDQWKEIWFPVKEIGGIQEVSPMGILNVNREKGVLHIGINALAFAKAKVVVRSGNQVIFAEEKSFSPEDVYKTSVQLTDDAPYNVNVEGMDLEHGSVDAKLISRPFKTTVPADSASVYAIYQKGIQFKENRNYKLAKTNLEKCLDKDPLFIDAMSALCELYFRSNQPDSALYYANRALQLDAYHPAANYYAGVTYRSQGDFINALETLGWAARSVEFRSEAYSQMAGIEVRLNDYKQASGYALQSLDYNRFNVNAMATLAVISRKLGNQEQAKSRLDSITRLDPLNHFAAFERYLLNPESANLDLFKSGITNEFPYQTYLELALTYDAFGLNDDALKVLGQAPEHTLVALWKAYLSNDKKQLEEVAKLSPAFVFPYRTETVSALKWAVQNSTSWKFKYFLGLNYWAIQREQDAIQLVKACGDEPDFAPFYTSRAYLLNKENEHTLELTDLQKAKQLNPEDWRNWGELVGFYENSGENAVALALSTVAVGKFKDNFNVGLQHARVQLNNGQYLSSIRTLQKLNILPFEGSVQGKYIFEQAHLFLAIDLVKKGKYKEAIGEIGKSKDWPENLGAGKPYDPDIRMQNYLEAICYEKLGRRLEAKSLQDEIINYTEVHYAESGKTFNNLLALHIFRQRGETESADALIKKLKEPDTYAKPTQQWIVAYFTNDTKTCEKLEKDMSRNAYYMLLKSVSNR